MTGQFNDKYMDQLESWIGTGPKIFTLLYQITRDGCNATTFHQKCDNQGPTVTVLYNQQGSVYGVYGSASWYLETLTEDIVSFKPSGKLGLSDVRILMLGPVGTGKSSFYNTIDSVFKGRISRSAPCGLSTNCKTIAYTPYEVHVMSGASLNFRLCDTRGLEVTQGLDSVECNYLLDGNISDLYQFNPVAPIRSANPGFVHQPTVEEQFHCVLFLIDAAKVGDIPQKLVDKMHSFQKRVILKG
ncbi:interferon-induced protein 44-like [Dreissena polymorpha]|uniref:interferon-induced protein 44-like n=1 Tax=Dreissena polymorpha TaxID=45954 RepID=UPI00226466EC|nr:interferon-induced protein 44-like [Dreissena polymorpha]